MQKTRKQTHPCQATKNCHAVILLMGCLLGGGTSRFVGAQTVNVSVRSSEIDHGMESVIVFQTQSRERTDAYIHVYDDIPLKSGSNAYTATYTNSSGCKSTETFTITVN